MNSSYEVFFPEKNRERITDQGMRRTDGVSDKGRKRTQSKTKGGIATVVKKTSASFRGRRKGGIGWVTSDARLEKGWVRGFAIEATFSMGFKTRTKLREGCKKKSVIRKNEEKSGTSLQSSGGNGPPQGNNPQENPKKEKDHPRAVKHKGGNGGRGPSKKTVGVQVGGRRQKGLKKKNSVEFQGKVHHEHNKKRAKKPETVETACEGARGSKKEGVPEKEKAVQRRN